LSLGEGGSAYYKDLRDNRNKVNNLTFTGSDSGGDKKFCNVCSVALRIKEIDGVNHLWCTSCNSITPLEAGSVESVANSMYTSRYGSTGKSNFFIISQKKKKQTAEELEKESIRKELGGRDGLTVVDSKESVYGEGTWTG
jgi:hypothetical protein